MAINCDFYYSQFLSTCLLNIFLTNERHIQDTSLGYKNMTVVSRKSTSVIVWDLSEISHLFSRVNIFTWESKWQIIVIQTWICDIFLKMREMSPVFQGNNWQHLWRMKKVEFSNKNYISKNSYLQLWACQFWIFKSLFLLVWWWF